ncbi:MAG: hypothetical protein WA208_05505 [Thermoanaerobaculia bacterium]
MKRVAQLLPGDLELIAVWRYEGSTDDDAIVHATDRVALEVDDAGVYLARTQFILAEGSQHTGFCSPAGDERLECLQPAIVTSEGLVFFWFAEPPSGEMLQAQWARLGVIHEDVFPVHFRCTVPFGGRYITGIITAEDLTGAA